MERGFRSSGELSGLEREIGEESLSRRSGSLGLGEYFRRGAGEW